MQYIFRSGHSGKNIVKIFLYFIADNQDVCDKLLKHRREFKIEVCDQIQDTPYGRQMPGENAEEKRPISLTQICGRCHLEAIANL